jgi:hypothetical protein
MSERTSEGIGRNYVLHTLIEAFQLLIGMLLIPNKIVEAN